MSFFLNFETIFFENDWKWYHHFTSNIDCRNYDLEIGAGNGIWWRGDDIRRVKLKTNSMVRRASQHSAVKASECGQYVHSWPFPGTTLFSTMSWLPSITLSQFYPLNLSLFVITNDTCSFTSLSSDIFRYLFIYPSVAWKIPKASFLFHYHVLYGCCLLMIWIW